MFVRAIFKGISFKSSQKMNILGSREYLIPSYSKLASKMSSAFYFPKNNFSSSQNPIETEIETILNEMGKKGNQEFEEPYVPSADLDKIKALRNSINQNITLGNMEKAHTDAYENVKLVKKYYGVNHPALYSALNNLALIYKLVGEFQHAKLLYTKIVEGYLNLFGHKHLSTITIMQNLANLMREMKEFDGAVKIYEDVLALRKELNPEKKIEQAVCMSSMAGAYRELGKYDKSESYLDEALKIFIAETGESSLNTANALNNLGMNFKRQKKFSKAEENYLKALKIKETLLSNEHPDILAIKHNLGELYHAMGNEEKAQEYMIEVMETIKKVEEGKNKN